MAMGRQATIVIDLALLFGSAIGELYFPELLGINKVFAKANLMFVADAMGNILAVLAPSAKQVAWRDLPLHKGLVPALVDMVSKIFILGGMALATAQAKSILYNSCLVFSALLAYFILHRRYNVGQLVGLTLLVIGFLVKVSPEFQKVGLDSLFTMVGMLMILVGCALHSLTNVVNEYYIRKLGFPEVKLCCIIGCCNLTIWLLAFACGLLIPEKNGNTGVFTEDMLFFRKGLPDAWPKGDLTAWDKDFSPMNGGLAWIGFVAASAVHAIAYFRLLGSIGVVSTGVMKGAVTAAYVALSAVIMCDMNQTSSPDLSKFCVQKKPETAISALICVVGVLVYTYFTAQAQQEPADAKALETSEDPEACGLKSSAAEQKAYGSA
jgi:drug/metabolite transporter (DMT)-like permease